MRPSHVVALPTHRTVGLQGEHYVCMRLAEAGTIPAMLTEGAVDVDIVAVLGGKSCTLQVKTRKTTPGRVPGVVDWNPARMTRPDFVVVVVAPEGDAPTAYVLPRVAVGKVWKLAGYQHPIRCNVNLTRAKPVFDRYVERWDGTSWSPTSNANPPRHLGGAGRPRVGGRPGTGSQVTARCRLWGWWVSGGHGYA